MPAHRRRRASSSPGCGGCCPVVGEGCVVHLAGGLLEIPATGDDLQAAGQDGRGRCHAQVAAHAVEPPGRGHPLPDGQRGRALVAVEGVEVEFERPAGEAASVQHRRGADGPIEQVAAEAAAPVRRVDRAPQGHLVDRVGGGAAGGDAEGHHPVPVPRGQGALGQVEQRVVEVVGEVTGAVVLPDPVRPLDLGEQFRPATRVVPGQRSPVERHDQQHMLTYGHTAKDFHRRAGQPGPASRGPCRRSADRDPPVARRPGAGHTESPRTARTHTRYGPRPAARSLGRPARSSQAARAAVQRRVKTGTHEPGR